jgi:hypothetical protein
MTRRASYTYDQKLKDKIDGTFPHGSRINLSSSKKKQKPVPASYLVPKNCVHHPCYRFSDERRKAASETGPKQPDIKPPVRNKITRFPYRNNAPRTGFSRPARELLSFGAFNPGKGDKKLCLKKTTAKGPAEGKSPRASKTGNPGKLFQSDKYAEYLRTMSRFPQVQRQQTPCSSICKKPKRKRWSRASNKWHDQFFPAMS